MTPMFRTRLTALAVAGAAAAVFATAACAYDNDAYTTRIVPTDTYGATVTMEEGVRVFRPFPSERHVIINPEGRAPVGLNYYYDPLTGFPVRGQWRR